MTLIEFLTARLDEDEAGARAASEAAGHETWGAFGYEDIASVGAEHPDHPDGEEWYLLGGNLLRQSGERPLVEHVARHDPARVLREVAAKRAVLGALEAADERDFVFVVRALAAVYADHPDYRAEWSPR